MRFMHRRRIVLATALVSVAYVTPVEALTCTDHPMVTGDPATTSFGNPDWRWQVVSSPSGNAVAPAYVVQLNEWYGPGPSEPRWISSSGANTGAPSWGDPTGYYTYRTYWYDPPGGTSGVSASFAVDNAVDVYINGTHWSRYSPPSSDLAAAFRHYAGKSFTIGQGAGRFLDGQANYLDMRVEILWDSPQGLFVWGNIRICT